MGWFAETYKKFQENMTTSFRDIAVDTLFLAGGLCSGGLCLLGTSAVVGYRMQKRIEKGQRQKFLKSGELLPAVLKKWREKTGKEKRATVLNWMVADVGAYFLGYANGLAALGYTLLGETALRHVAMHESIAYGKRVNDINSDKWLSFYQKKKMLKNLDKKRIIPFLWMVNSNRQPKKFTVFAGQGTKRTVRHAVKPGVQNIKNALLHAKGKIIPQIKHDTQSNKEFNIDMYNKFWDSYIRK